MKREGIWTPLAVAVAVIGVTSFNKPADHPTSEHPSAIHQASSGGSSTNSPPNPPAPVRVKDGPCKEIEQHLQSFLQIDSENEFAPASCYAATGGKETDLPTHGAENLQIVIATSPDPSHTHLSLAFDREMEAIQQAATDRGYFYDSSWLPWHTTESQYLILHEQDEAAYRKERREDQPGILLFRGRLLNSPDNAPADFAPKPFDRGLLVLVVGEETTGGIHREQFKNAIAWAKVLHPDGAMLGKELSILGPFASGSIPSLAQLLTQDSVKKMLEETAVEPIRVFSGHVSNGVAAMWLQNQLSQSPPRIDFKSFQITDQEVLGDVCTYLENIGIESSHLSVLSEDETAFGSALTNSRKLPESLDTGSVQQRQLYERLRELQRSQGRCLSQHGEVPSEPTFLFYPRDISTLRSAYQQQALLGDATDAISDVQRKTLRNNLADPEGKEHDTVKSYAGEQEALSQEGVMQQIVSMLRAHKAQFVLLRSSNPVDVVFLARYLKEAYPEGRIITQSGDVLLRRELGAGGLAGILNIGTYPPLAQSDDWDSPDPKPFHGHRVFAQSTADGEYVALTLLLRPHLPFPLAPAGGGLTSIADSFVPWACEQPSSAPQVGALGIENQADQPMFKMPAYSYPFWLKASGCRRPAVWLTVLGRDDFYPLATFTNPTLEKEPDWRWWSVLSGIGAVPKELAHRWPPIPVSFRLVAAALMLLALFNAFLCSHASLMVRPEHRCYFVRARGPFQVKEVMLPPPGKKSKFAGMMKVLYSRVTDTRRIHSFFINLASACIMFAVLSLAQGCGWMSAEPMADTVWFHLYPLVMWVVCLYGVGANAWIEHQLRRDRDLRILDSLRHLRNRRYRKLVLHVVGRPIGLFMLLTLGWCFTMSFYVNRQLRPETRFPAYLRGMELTSGVSPVVPLLVLSVGGYVWCWCCLRSLALLGGDRPVLPPVSELAVRNAAGSETLQLTMISREEAGEKIDSLCEPLSPDFFAAAFISLGLLLILKQAVFHVSPIHSLGNMHYTNLVVCSIILLIAIVIGNGWQLVHIWLKLKNLLNFLDRLPLRRTLQAMGGFSWGSIWNVGGNVIEIRDQLTYRQFECLNHLASSLRGTEKKETEAVLIRRELRLACLKRIDATAALRFSFNQWYSLQWDNWKARSRVEIYKLQNEMALLAGYILTHVLVPIWRGERDSLLLQSDWTVETEGGAAREGRMKPHLPPLVQSAEELVCLVFLGFIQNVIGRMRSLAFGVIGLFLALSIMVASYPFNPRPLLTHTVVVLFLGLGCVIFSVYSQMFRNAALSHLTNTRPGELGAEFWLKIFSLGIGPILALIALLFPDVGDSISSWLQPSLSAIK